MKKTVLLSLILTIAMHILPVFKFFYTFAVETYDSPKIEHLKSKSLLDTTALYNIKSVYSNKSSFLDIKNRTNSTQLLSNDLIFNDFKIEEWNKNSLKAEFNSSDITKNFKSKNVDIFGAYYGANCVGEVGKNTACIYGGITLHEKSEGQKHNIGVNVLKNNIQQKGFVISTSKKEPTAQELDLKTRNILQDQYKLYNSETGDIQRGYIQFHSDTSNVYYDLFDFNGKYSSDFLKFYGDNKLINTKNLHIDVYLFSA
ncbi:exotoxin OB-fold domain-containing protein [Staphylococcus hyicus]|uniref:exotoxin OB-fold domain-containing protein n=1 Tax=Staphylococcus hyicus TaxID=1284 RepID=UPI001F3AF6FC|nr:exotoxin beta-grasp domain-containing protein [Staphylococcus hyicus]